MFQLFTVFQMLLGQKFGQYLCGGYLRQDAVEVLAEKVMEMIVNNVLNRLSKTFKNIQILGLGKPFDFQ